MSAYAAMHPFVAARRDIVFSADSGLVFGPKLYINISFFNPSHHAQLRDELEAEKVISELRLSREKPKEA